MTARVDRIKFNCRHCGREFGLCPGVIKSNARRGRTVVGAYCSRACCHRAGRVTEKCARCGKDFEHYRSVSRKYCSKVCASTAGAQVSATCVVCANVYTVVRSRQSKTKCCSFHCLIRYNAGRNQLKGREAKNRTARPSWRARRREVLDRDGHKCWRCGATEDLTVHHIVPWRKSRDDSHDNLTTLCRSCHFRVEYRNAALPRGMGVAA